MSGLSHLDPNGRARMVDVGSKSETARTAEAVGRLRMGTDTLKTILSGKAPKGEVIRTAELAGVLAAKRTPELIPLCHPLPLSAVDVVVTANPALPGFEVRAIAEAFGRTGVEMEALTAVSVACLTLYDMIKSIDRDLVVEGIELVAKAGGQSGDWRRA